MINKLSTLIFIFMSMLSYAQADTINVAVAANFKQTLVNLKSEFETQTPHQINIITASTGQLTQQITHGAPFDILLAANTSHPQTLWQKLHKERKLNQDALTVYALGRLVFYSQTPLKLTDTPKSVLNKAAYPKISVANARLAPYGLAAEQTLKCLNLYNLWKPKLIVGQNIAQTFQFIDSKNVAAGFVAMSQVLDKSQEHVHIVDESCYQPIKQSALRLNNKRSSYEFMAFLSKPATLAIIEAHGYLLPK
ncbi:molybdate ABC transporter substrate-binding protein [Oceaniserpentilla sp. 4NH20-0058]|uniref:molybdate ABC transporter substrate-binding protein n=1 Tax=Oceaniserpentilla sp. 4NH20-0058 TaxID=3127660 RepID=UPI003101EAD3